MKRSSVYWLCPVVDETHLRRASILDDIGYQVFFFENLDTLIKEVTVKRAQIVILGDEWPSEVAIRCVHTFANIPDINAARLLIANSRNEYALMEAAAQEGFRDIIPSDLSDTEWLQRFEFATSGIESILTLHEGLEAIDETIEISIPARLVWVSSHQLWLETRACARAGEHVQFDGFFPQSLGLTGLDLLIQQRQQTNLTFRFSEALIGSWNTDASANAAPQRIQDTLEQLSQIDLGLRPRIFLAIQSPALRTTLLKYLDRRKYEVHSALHKNSLLYEPRFFSPDLVFIEERLMQGESRRHFHELNRFLPEHATIVAIGARDDSPAARNGGGERRLRTLKHVPLNLTDLIDRDYLANLAQRRGTPVERKAYFPPHEHPLSFGSIRAVARLQGADYLQFDMSTPTRIGPYTLLRAESPWLQQTFGGPVYLKVVESPDSLANTEPPFRFKAHLCNLVAPLQSRKRERKTKGSSSKGR